MVAWAVLLLAVVAATLLHLLYNYSRLKSVSGPILAAFTDAWRANAQRSSSSSEYGRLLKELHRKYGVAVRLGPGFVSLSEVGDITRVYHTLLQDEYESAADTAMRNLVHTVRRCRTVDMTTLLHFFADEVNTRLFWSACAPSAASSASSRTHRIQPSFSFFATIEELVLRGPVALLKRERLSCYCLSGDVSAKIYGNELVLPTGPSATRKLAISAPDGLILAASIQIITKAFVSVFFFLLNNPLIMRRLRQEIESIPRFRNRTKLPSSRDLGGLYYLDAVFKETMRLVILQSQPMEVRVTFESLYISSKHVPRGTVLSWHPHVVLTNDAIYENNLYVFRPERWLTPNRQRQTLMEASLLPFMVCRIHYPKLEAAWLLLKKTVVVLLREFCDINLTQTEGQTVADGMELPPWSMVVDFIPRPATAEEYVGQLL
ncbi:protein CYP5120B1 [Aspergillus nidulans FGSC A4]|uniref:Cytochrome P450, putative (Eurofung) n=1 Tax=Emericella nidulans (strain FGSC A4 / ATCC 38163 / CBS 112.46 / NRRL 194 / M139) TaxID=227321 RepID=C8VGU2_EMENI|nr:protein CYP5120B1 [Aspergillus nidulans FGSC A4]CBF82081.1 TPA: cytochrome P450, putative (Eurofung) [Aspergillus nidulans FGSC A4]